MDVDQLDSKLLEYRDRDRNTVDLADVLAIEIDLALDGRFSGVGHIVGRKPRRFRHVLENCADCCLLRAGPDHIAIGALA